MKFEIKNLKHSEFASHETHCFEATLYVDGKRTAIVENDGNGGADLVTPIKPFTHADIRKIEEHIKTLPNYKFMDEEFEQSLEVIVGDLVNEALNKKRLKSLLSRFICTFENGGIYTYRYRGSKDRGIQLIKEQKPEAQVLNCLTFEAAFDFFKKA